MPKTKVTKKADKLVKSAPVKVYSTPSCPYCHMAMDFLKEHKVKFVEVDVSADENAAEQMIDKSGQMGVPVLDINGTIIVGFNKDAIKKALKLK